MRALAGHNKELLKAHIGRLTVNEFLKCNETVLNSPPPTDGVYCPAIFDGWHCFNYTKAGTTAFSNCLPFDEWDPNQQVHRYCEPNGTWEINKIRGSPWTNTSSCNKNSAVEPNDTLHIDNIHIYIYLAGAALSLVLLVTSLIIFAGFKQLRCGRVIIHQNLFMSLVFTALSFILYYTLVSLDAEVQLINPIWCQILHVLCQYFTLSNFSWMFFESLYLHIILAHAFTTGKKALKIIISCAWGVPIVVTIVYALVRVYVVGTTNLCWTESDEDNVLYIIAVPIMVSLALNIVMLINMVRLIKTKLQRTPEAGHNRKAIKAVLILVPMFGLQFLIFPLRPEIGTDAYYVYLNIMAFLMSTQGTWVSIIFCFCNGEVRSLLRRKWHQHLLMSTRSKRNFALTSSTYADQDSVLETKRDASHSQKSKPVWDGDKDGMKLKPLTDTVENGKTPSSRRDFDV